MKNIFLKNALVVFLLMTTALAGCLGDDDDDEELEKLTLAFQTKDDYENVDENPQELADKLGDMLDMDVSIYSVDSESATLEALRFGNADLGFVDGGSGWVGWQTYGLEVMAADQKSDGRTYYNGHAWVLADSEMAAAHLDDDPMTDPFSLLEGKTSCHTGWLKSAGMLLPMGYLIGNGYANVIGPADDIESLRSTVTNFFSEDASIPDSGTPYYSYSGAVKCLSDGTGDVAFAKDSTVDSYCDNEDASTNEAWCLARDQYVALPTFGKAPSHPVMYNPETMSNEKMVEVQSALVELGSTAEGEAILSNILNTPGMTATTAAEHLGGYGDLMSAIPGINTYFGGKYGLNDTVEPTVSEVVVAFELKDDYENIDENPQIFADYLEEKMGVDVTLYPVNSEGAIIEALRFGHAHIGFMDGGAAWVGWKEYGLATLAADQKSDGRTYYNAHAWVRNGSDIAAAQLDGDDSTDPFALLQGKTSCHTGWLKSAGMLLPMGYMISNDYAEVVGDSDDIESLRNTILSFFSSDASIPDSGTPYYGYSGAVKCLSDGTGDVAFAKDSTVDSYCGNDDAADNEAWCLARDEYIALPAFGQAPSHPVMYNPDVLDIQTRTAILNALLSLNNEMWVTDTNDDGQDICYNMQTHAVSGDNQSVCEAYVWYDNASWGNTTYTGCYNMESHQTNNDTQAVCEAYGYYENYGASTNSYCYNTVTHEVDSESAQSTCGGEILSNILNTPGLVETNTQEHLGSYSGLISSIPGIGTYYDTKFDIE